MKYDLLPCPFCGFVLDINDSDCIYPATRPIYNPVSKAMEYPLYEVNCYESGGGCGANLLGETVEDCIRLWNTRRGIEE
jgi:hypothetical protein